MSKRNRITSDKSTRNFLIILAAMMAGVLFCVGTIILGSFWMTRQGTGLFQSESEMVEQVTQQWATDSAELTVAVSPVMAPVLALRLAQEGRLPLSTVNV